MSSPTLPSAVLPRSNSIDEHNWIAADNKIDEGVPSSAFSFNADQFDFVDFGTSISQSASSKTQTMLDQPLTSGENTVGDLSDVNNFSGFLRQDSPFNQPQTVVENTVGELGTLDDFTDFFQKDLENLNQDFELPDISLADLELDFDFSMPAEASTQISSESDPRYVPFTANQFAYPPPSNPSIEPSNPYTFPQQQYPWEAGQNLATNYEGNFGAITPPGMQSSSLHPSMPIDGSMARHGRKYTPLPINPPGDLSGYPEEYALSPTATFYRKRRPINHSRSSSHMTKKARRATIKNYLHAKTQSQSAQPSQYGNNDNNTDSSDLSSPPLSPSHNISDHSPDDHIPTNVFNARHMNPRTARQRMEAIKARRRAYFGIPQATNPSTSAPEFLIDESHGGAPARIQGRRKKHPGRKIRVAQTPEVIARNAARRERYRMSLPPKQRALYDAEKPAEVTVADTL